MKFEAFFGCALAAATCLSLHAAQPAGVLRGVVSDSKGTAVAGADITITRDGVAVSQQRTDPSGSFAFDGPAREYSVEVTAAGFQPLQSSPIPFAPRGVTHFTLAHPGEVIDPVAGPGVQRSLSGPGWEYGVVAQGGVGTEDRSSYKFFLLGGHAGRVLTSNLGSGLLQGNFEYAVEVFPLWQSYTPRFQKVSCLPSSGSATGYQCSQAYTVGGTYTGVSITPIMLRWNLTHGQRWRPWLQGAGGVVWTNHKYPAIGNINTADIASNGPSGDTSVWNFTPQFGIGTHYFVRPRRSVDFSANAVHLSSASLGDKNPGVNASVQFSFGYTWWK